MRELIVVGAVLLVASAARAAEPPEAGKASEVKATEAAAMQPAEEAASEAAPATAEAPARKKARPKIAVLDVRTAGTLDPKTFDGLSGLIASEVASRAPAVQVIGSGDIRAMVGFEREKQLMGCSESDCLAEIGGALGVDWMLTTEGSKLGSTWILTMVLIDVPRARPIKRLSQRTAKEDRLVDEAVAAVAQLVSELPRDETAAPVAATVKTAPAAGGRSKALSWTLAVGGAAAIVVGAVTVGLGWGTKNNIMGDINKGTPTGVTRTEAVNANRMATAGYVVGAVGVAAALWGGLRLALPENAPAQVAFAPAPDGFHAAVTVRLP